MLTEHWHLYRWLLLAVVLLMAVSTWATVTWWEGVADRLAVIQQQRQAVRGMPSSITTVSRVGDFDNMLPVPYQLIGSIRGDIAPSPGNETLAVGEDTKLRQYQAFVLSADRAVAFRTTLPSAPDALEVRTVGAVETAFRLLFPAVRQTGRVPAPPPSITIRWDGSRYVAEAAVK